MATPGSDLEGRQLWRSSVTAQGGRLLIGDQSYDRADSESSGNVQAFRRSGGDFSSLEVPVPESASGFGEDTALSEKWMVVSATSEQREENDDGEDLATGVVYVAEGLPSSVDSFDQLTVRARPGGRVFTNIGGEVATTGDSVLVNQFGISPENNRDSEDPIPGRVFHFRPSGGGWDVSEVLLPPGEHKHSFGRALAADNDTLVVGQHLDSTRRDNGGAVLVYERGSNGFKQRTRLDAPDEQRYQGAAFGRAVDVAGQTLAVSVPGVTISEDPPSTGVVRLYDKQDDGWTLSTELVPDGIGAQAGFGLPLALNEDGTRLLAGWTQFQEKDEVIDRALMGYVFDRQGGEWRHTRSLFKQNADFGDLFVTSAAIDGGWAYVGGSRAANSDGVSADIYAYNLSG